jgi:Lar family restriction alleviation protein
MENLNNTDKTSENAEKELRISDVMCSLPCPFCGSDTEIETTTFGDCMTDYFRVNCKQKGHSLDWWEEDKNEAIAVWNERQ